MPQCESTRAFNGSSEVKRDGHQSNVEIDVELEIGVGTYYDCVVSKTDADYQLRPEHLRNAEYPSEVNGNNITICGKKLYPCAVQLCTSKPFTRYYDLDRHFRSIHESCDYKKTPDMVKFRKDHCREHCLEYHKEDLETRKKSKKTQAFPVIHSQVRDLQWWRCYKCLQQIKLDESKYTCPNCEGECDPERLAWRQKIITSEQSGWDAKSSIKASIADNYIGRSTAKEIKMTSQGSFPLHSLVAIERCSRSTDLVRKISPARTSRDINLECFLITVALMAGLLMGLLYTWINQRIQYRVPSALMREIMKAAVVIVPTKVIEASCLVPTNLMLMSYLAASAVWSISIVGWIKTHWRKLQLVYSYMYLFGASIFWVLSGVTPEELVLAFLPVSISIGGLLWASSSRPKGRDPARIGYDTSLSVTPIERQNCLYPAVEGDEINSKV